MVVGVEYWANKPNCGGAFSVQWNRKNDAKISDFSNFIFPSESMYRMITQPILYAKNWCISLNSKYPERIGFTVPILLSFQSL